MGKTGDVGTEIRHDYRSTANERCLDGDRVVEARSHLGPTQAPLTPINIGVYVKGDSFVTLRPESSLKLGGSAHTVEGERALQRALSRSTKMNVGHVENHARVLLYVEEVGIAQVFVALLVLCIDRVSVDDNAAVDAPIGFNGAGTFGS